ncbi:hypothetical protein [Micropruina glycogenica]|uniref:Uncharacterized protein n=1 Tax=Micropruina glycogenica TaxID=75385 RepID=A0A2N9JJR0_9ACTN|nr:hypothetical protein [Micropruina glycogenica]SPD87788.1 putative Uncharacterised protein [Micropruina glycogenica]
MIAPLFNPGKRTDSRPALYGETDFEFLDRVAGNYWQQVRDLLQLWVDHLPASERRDVCARLQGRAASQQASALLELYLHEVLLRSGCAIQIHPNVPGTNRQPDFLATPTSGDPLYVEAVVPAYSDLARAELNRRSQLIDAINRKPHPRFALVLKHLEVGQTTLSSKSLITEIHQWLDRLPPDPDPLTTRSFPSRPNNQGWRISLGVMPWTQKALQLPNRRAIGAQTSGGIQKVDHFGPVQRALASKESKYGKPNHPLVVAIGTSFLDDPSHLTNGFYGSLHTDMGTTPPVVTREFNGYFGSADLPLHQQVSVVLVVHNLSPWRVTGPVVAWHHPWPQRDLPDQLGIPSDAYRLVDRMPQQVAFQGDIASVLGLPQQWPSGAPW